jgi:hypothetical protein
MCNNILLPEKSEHCRQISALLIACNSTSQKSRNIYIYFVLSTMFVCLQKFQQKRYYGINIKVTYISIHNTASSSSLFQDTIIF